MDPIQMMNSLSPEQIRSEIKILRAFSKKICGDKVAARRVLAAVRKRSRPPVAKQS